MQQAASASIKKCGGGPLLCAQARGHITRNAHNSSRSISSRLAWPGLVWPGPVHAAFNNGITIDAMVTVFLHRLPSIGISFLCVCMLLSFMVPSSSSSSLFSTRYGDGDRDFHIFQRYSVLLLLLLRIYCVFFRLKKKEKL